MAQTKSKDPSNMTWQEKLDAGIPLTVLEEVKADADFNYRRRLREEEERKAFEKIKSAGRTNVSEAAAQVAADEEVAAQAESDGEGSAK